MNKKKTILAALLALAMLLALTACSGSGSAKEARAPYVGEYTMFAGTADGYTIEAEALGMTSVLTLEDNGKGYLTINDEGGPVSAWSVEGGRISVTSGVDTMTGSIADGVVMLDYDDGYFIYYAREGADTSSVGALSEEEYIDILIAEALGE